MDDPAVWARMIGGSLAAGVVAWTAFHRPSWVRSTTTRWRCALGACLHALLYIAWFWLAGWVFARLVGVPLRSAGPAWVGLLVVLTTLGITPVARRPREWLRHRVARAPFEAQRLARRLGEAEYRLDPARAEQARVMLLRRGVDVSNDWLPITQPAHQLMLRATVIFLQILAWEEQGRYSALLDEARNEFDELRQRFDRLTLRAARSLCGIERVGEIRLHHNESAGGGDDAHAQQIDRPLRALVNDLNADLCDDANAFYREACMLCARAVLSAHRSSRRRIEALGHMGFTIAEEPMQSGYMALFNGLVVLMLGMTIYLVFAPSLKSDVLEQEQLFVVIVATQLAALAFAIVPKLHFGFANAGLTRRTPRDFVLGAGLAAASFHLLLNASAGYLVGDWEGLTTRLHEVRFIVLSPFTTAACMAWLVQDHRWRHVDGALRRRLLDGLVLGGTWFGISLTLQAIRLALGGSGQSSAFGEVAMRLFYAFCFGGAIGLTVPHLVRPPVRQLADAGEGTGVRRRLIPDAWTALFSHPSAKPAAAAD